MKREEKNRQTRRRILDSAVAEFGREGYTAGSINTICAEGGVSKGIIYHYFKSKDELYLACVEECFGRLVERIESGFTYEGAVEEQLERYFAVRGGFFQEHPEYQRIFFEVLVSPPGHLRDEIARRRQAFDELNGEIFERILQPVPLREGVTKEEVMESFSLFQELVNTKYRSTGDDDGAVTAREESCRRALDILLYGVVDRRRE